MANAESDALIGTWKLVSWEVIVDNGTEQRRRYRIEGDRLFIESAPSFVFPGKTDFRRGVWERKKLTLEKLDHPSPLKGLTLVFPAPISRAFRSN